MIATQSKLTRDETGITVQIHCGSIISVSGSLILVSVVRSMTLFSSQTLEVRGWFIIVSAGVARGEKFRP
jgi:hypothetical protein